MIGYDIDFFAMYNPDALFQRSDRVAMEAEFSLHAGVSTDGKPEISGPLILLGISVVDSKLLGAITVENARRSFRL